ALASWMTNYGPEALVQGQYYVLIGHTKGEHDFGAIANNLMALKKDGRFEFLGLSQMAQKALEELEGSRRKDSRDEAQYQVQRETNAIMGEERNEAPSFLLQDL